MRISHYPKLEEQINKAARVALDKKSESRTVGLHMSDLLSPRLGYFRLTDPKPVTDAEVGYFIAGLAHHDVILSIMKRKNIDPTGETDEGSVKWGEVYYSPDYNMGFLAEIKTSRRPFEPQHTNKDLKEAYDSYLKQLTAYMAVDDKPVAALVVFYISLRVSKKSKNKNTAPTFKAYKVTMSEKERIARRAELTKIEKLLKKSVKAKNPKYLPLCEHWKCCRGGYRGPATAACKWYEECKPKNRYPLDVYAKNRKAGMFSG